MPSASNIPPKPRGQKFANKLIAILKKRPKATKPSVEAEAPSDFSQSSSHFRAPISYEKRSNVPRVASNLRKSRNLTDKECKLLEEIDSTGDDSGYFENSDLSERCEETGLILSLEPGSEGTYNGISTSTSQSLISPKSKILVGASQSTVIASERHKPSVVQSPQVNLEANVEPLSPSRCLATTEKGTQCTYRAEPGEKYCSRWHLAKYGRRIETGVPELETSGSELQSASIEIKFTKSAPGACLATTQKGTQCTFPAAPGQKYCSRWHLARYGRQVKTGSSVLELESKAVDISLDGICLAITQKGTRCTFRAASGENYCSRWHLKKHGQRIETEVSELRAPGIRLKSMSISVALQGTCKAVTQKGTRCTFPAALGEDYCSRWHLAKYGGRVKTEDPELKVSGLYAPRTESQSLVTSDRLSRKSEPNLARCSKSPKQEDWCIPVAPPVPLQHRAKIKDLTSSLPGSSAPRPRCRSFTPCPEPLEPQFSRLPSVPYGLRSHDSNRNAHLRGEETRPCLGTTKGVNCAFSVKSHERYCEKHQGHQLEWNENEFWLKGRLDSIQSFDDWIPHYVSETTRKRLKDKMTQVMTTVDRDRYGYVYAYQHFDPKKTEEVHIKVGRTVDVGKRFQNWESQCGKRIERLGWWPQPPKQKGGANRTMIEDCEPAKYHWIIERLVLLELNDTEAHSLHLLSGYPYNVERRQRPSYMRLQKDPCENQKCRRVHIEIFSFKQPNNNEVPNIFPPKEWANVVWQLIDKWGQFVELYLEGRVLD